MAESVVTSYFLEKVGALLEGEANLFFGVKGEVRSLVTELEFIRSFLRDANEKRTRNNERSVKVWVGQVGDVAFDVEDVIDSFILKEELQRQRNMALRIICYLNRLYEGESWELFSKKVVSCPTELEELGKKIVDKCGGLPLAIVVSYSCFLYFGLFPEDAEIRADRLIRLWIAEGFVQQRGEEMMEDVAEDYLEELIHRSLIQVGQRRRFDGGVETCRIHDLLRDLAISEAKQDKFLDICVEPSSRRLAIHPVANGNDSRAAGRQLDNGGLDKLTDLRELSTEGEESESTPAAFLPLVSFSQHVYLYKLFLRGQLEKLPNLVDFPPNLTQLSLYFSFLTIERQQEDEDAPQPQNRIMATLEQLPNLRVLVLGWRSYVEKEMIFTAGGFPKLQDLSIHGLEHLEEWRVEKGAMPCLQSLDLMRCHRLKMLPDGLRHVTTLQKIFLYQGDNPGLKARVEKDRGEDWYKIQHVPSITINIE
ncbi:hypothetical protein HHK36_021982 [Tetracentron sinense]|uniref:Uncharacterized protein n=1 Tax=Tetracentron sinense TaxID=13715 RepID=A0A834YS88_TETSI|nr:hypothetical protein HHK36_021982 [Tetracentron sinense]